MKGSPLMISAWVLAGSLVLGLLVWRTTTNGNAEVIHDPMSHPVATTEDVTLRLHSSGPARVAVVLEGKLLFEGVVESGGQRVVMELPELGADLVVRATGGSDDEVAIRFRVERDGELIVDKTVWAQGEVQEVLPIPGRRPHP